MGFDSPISSREEQLKVEINLNCFPPSNTQSVILDSFFKCLSCDAFVFPKKSIQTRWRIECVEWHLMSNEEEESICLRVSQSVSNNSKREEAGERNTRNFPANSKWRMI